MRTLLWRGRDRPGSRLGHRPRLGDMVAGADRIGPEAALIEAMRDER